MPNPVPLRESNSRRVSRWSSNWGGWGDFMELLGVVGIGRWLVLVGGRW
jgi:hypothetical protein